MGFNLQNDLKCFFIDNFMHTKSHEHIIEDNQLDELDFLNNEVKKIEKFVDSQQPFICRDVK